MKINHISRFLVLVFLMFTIKMQAQQTIDGKLTDQ
jgi:hypothetical protein